jgi:hypothetical protein
VDLLGPKQALRAAIGFDPDALHLRLDLAPIVEAHTATGSVAQVLRASHGTGHAGVMQNALSTRMTAKNGDFDHLLDRYQNTRQEGRQSRTAEQERSYNLKQRVTHSR